MFATPEKVTLSVLLTRQFPMSINYFSLFRLPEHFLVNQQQLQENYHALAARFHPDKTVTLSAFEQKQSMMMAATLNQAYQTLNNPIDCAAYLLNLRGLNVDTPEHTQFSADFLMQQMSWRERLFNAQTSQNETELQELLNEIQAEQNQLIHQLNQLFEEEKLEEAAQLVRQARFFNKIINEVQNAL